MPYRNPENYHRYLVSWRKSHPEKMLQYKLRSDKKKLLRITELKEKILNKYGRKCKNCGFLDIRALQIDHVQNDGYLENSRSRVQRETLYKRVLADKENKYQLLCANCNWIKRLDKTICGSIK